MIIQKIGTGCTTSAWLEDVTVCMDSERFTMPRTRDTNVWEDAIEIKIRKSISKVEERVRQPMIVFSLHLTNKNTLYVAAAEKMRYNAR